VAWARLPLPFISVWAWQAREKVLLIDLDGIKRYKPLICRRRDRFRAFVNLGASLTRAGGLNKTDYLRAFKIYCNLTGLEKDTRKRLCKYLIKQVNKKISGS
jgi:hypothetical protein